MLRNALRVELNSLTKEDSKREIESLYMPLREWIIGNHQLDNNMKTELFEIVHDMIKRTIDDCYKSSMDILGGKKK